jgi:glycine/D-amino acid oxidase-like deaminating enzyme
VKLRHSAEGHWLDQAAPLMTAPLAPLSGEVAADVAIVGGGYTGMWCAWHVLEQAPDARIVLLESDRCGHGPSGRNGGFCHGNWLSLAALVERLGPQPALALARATQEAAEEIGRWCEEQDVDAWYRRGGELRVSTAVAHDDVGLASVRAAQALGAGDRLVDLTPAQVREHCDSPVFRRGVFAPDGATVHPGRLALGLRRRLLDRGVALHEYSHVRRVTGDAGGVTLETASARVRARHAVLASGGALARTGPMRGRVLVGSSHLIVTEPVPDVIEQLGWGDEAISDARSFLHYTRTTQDGRIAFGWAGGRPAFGGRVHGRVEIDPRIVSTLHAHLLRWFPMLEGRAIDHAWGGPIDITPSRLPAIVSLPGGPVHAAAGFTGNGVGPAHLVGRILASLALDRRDAVTSLPIVEPPSAWIPPEPLRWAGAHAVRAALLRTEDAEEAGERVPALARAVATAPGRLGITLGR